MSKRYPGGIIRKTPQTPSQTSAQGIWDMASVTQAVKENTWPIAGVPDPISKSLRFRSSASAYLNRTPASAGNRKTWTWSAWVKRGALANGVLLGTETVSAQTYCTIYYVSDKIYLDAASSNVETMRVYTNAVFRDPSAWYHVVVYLDTTQATASNRTAIYVNGVLQTLTVSTNPAQNLEPLVNSTVAHNIGRNPLNGIYFDGYMTEVYFIDGQALTPSSFGSTNDQTGVWQPIAYTGTYGTNGFYLPFSNTASTTTLGYDFSGNSNNWTTNNISLTSGSTYDSMVDVPTQWIPYNTAGDTGALFRGNYCVLNPLDQASSNTTITNANLTLNTSATNYGTRSTYFVSSGKWYWEATVGAIGTDSVLIGIADSDWNKLYVGNSSGSYSYFSNASKVNNATFPSYGATFTTNDVIGVAFDATSGTLEFFKNGTSQGTAFTGISGSFSPAFSGQISSVINVNFGQRPFSYTPPTGFNTLCTTNLSTPTIGATASTTANKYFNAVIYTGNNGTQTIATGFQPDFTWIKVRNVADDHFLYDSVRGATKYLSSNTTGAEGTIANGLTAFASTGFTLGDSGSTNNGSNNFASWSWKANGSGSTNTAGSITSTVSANTSAGFSIVTYTGNGTIGATIGHGLGVAPSMLIVKQRTGGSESWQVYHSFLGATQYLQLNSSGAAASNINRWNNTAPTSTVFTVYNDTINNGNTNTYVAYCFAQIANYSAFGGYTGNGSTDGPFIYTGFRPAFVIVKRSSAVTAWYMFDKARNPYNVVGERIEANTSSAEASGLPTFDFLSNGFKLRDSDAAWNGSGSTYVYMAFAESPFKFSLAR